MKWEGLFDQKILNRGRQYYENQRVRGLQKDGTRYQAEVIGTKPYCVTVNLRDEKLPSLICDCLYAKEGNRCKHMAAVLFAVENQMGELWEGATPPRGKLRVNRQIHPFVKSEEYSYFDFAAITDGQRIMERDYEHAQELIAEGNIRMEDFQIGYGSQQRTDGVAVRAEAVCFTDRTRGAVTSCIFDHKRLYALQCYADGCRVGYDSRWGTYGKPQRLCAHVLALLLLAQERIQKDNLGDATDADARHFLDAYHTKRRADISGENPAMTERVDLEPHLEWASGMLQLAARCGTAKLYVVKDFPELVDTVEKHGVMRQGKKTMLDFALCRFGEKSEKLYRFIRSVVREEEARDRNSQVNYRYNMGGEDIRGRIDLYGSRLDRFFDLYSGQSLPFTYRTSVRKDSTLAFEEGELRPKLVVESETDEDGVFHGVRLTGKIPEIIYGMEYAYLYRDERLVRIAPESERGLKPLLELAGYMGQINMVIGRHSLSEFYYRVLPGLSELADVSIKKKQEIERYLPPEVSFVFYLDAEDGNVTCTAKALYGEAEFNLIDWRVADRRKEAERDVQRETEALEEVEALFPGRDWEHDIFHCDNDADVIYNLLNTGLSRLMELGEVHTTERFRRLKIRDHARVTVGVSVQSEIMDLEVLSEDLTQEELLEILFHYSKKKKYYRLRNGDFLNLEDQSLAELAQMVETLHLTPKDFVKGKMHLPLYRALYLDKMLEQNEDIYAQRDRSFKKLVKEFKTVKDSDYELPESLKDIMRNYQKYGFRWLCTLRENHFGGILADDMGLGKTLQVISVLLSEKESGGTGTSLIVCPASLVYNWKEEFARFAPELLVAVLAGKKEERSLLLAEYQKWDVLVTSYDLLKRDIDEYEGKQFAYHIIDEAQYIKNQTTAAAKAVKLVTSRVRYALTGTPIENRLSELWSIFDFLMPGFLYSYENFKKDYETPIAKNQDAEATTQLRRMVSPFILRRLKKDVLKDLPDKLEEVQYAHMEEEQRRVYDGQVVRMRAMLEKQSDDSYRKSKLQVLAELTKIRQICCDPSLLFEDYRGESAKRIACAELIESAIEGGHRMLVFSQFVTMLELLKQDLRERNIPYYLITGETPKEERVRLVKEFNEGETPVFLISLKAGGTGLNLVGADVVIHYDPWWNLAVQNQATDRAHRIGQKKVVSVYRLIVKDSIEEKILKMQETKANLADEILSGEMGGLASLTREELMELLAV